MSRGPALSMMATALRLPEPLVAEPGVGSQRAERKIFYPFRQLDFVNVHSFRAVSQQNFLGFGFLLRGLDAHPDQQALRFRKPLQSQRTLAPQPPTRPKQRGAACNKPAHRREDDDGERSDISRDKIVCNGE